MAPEIIARKPYEGTAIDIFSLGVTFLVARTMTYPFENATTTDYNYMELQHNSADFWAPYKEQYNISDDFIALVSCMLQANPSGRPTMADIIGSKWMRGEVAT